MSIKTRRWAPGPSTSCLALWRTRNSCATWRPRRRSTAPSSGEAGNLLERNGCDAKGLNALEKMSTYLMIDMQTLTDRSASHVAEMMMVGSNMGVINAVKNLKKYPDADRDTRGLMERLLKEEEDNVQQLKKFL